MHLMKTGCSRHAVFSVNQPEYDDQMVIVPLDMAAKLFDYPQQASALEIKLKPKTNEKRVIASLSEHLGKDYLVKDRMMQQETSFRMMQIEKWMTFLILAFILMIATFNVIGSLSMLIIDKQNDIKTLQNLGADEKLISRIFLTEGWLISAIREPGQDSSPGYFYVGYNKNTDYSVMSNLWSIHRRCLSCTSFVERCTCRTGNCHVIRTTRSVVSGKIFA